MPSPASWLTCGAAEAAGPHASAIAIAEAVMSMTWNSAASASALPWP